MSSPLPAPVEGPNLHKLTDEGIAKYIEFPEDVIFMESAAHNTTFKKGVAYIPVQRQVDGSVQSFVYEISPNKQQPKLILGPLTVNSSTDITIFGSALTSTGILYLCCFNRNSLLVYDLKPATPSFLMEIPDLPSPNDMCVDPKNEERLYVAGGSFRRACGPCCCTFTNSARGQVFEVKVNIAKKKVTSHKVICSGLDVLAGIEVVDNTIWVAQLYDVFTIDQETRNVKTVWSGKDGQGQVWLADNMDLFPNGPDPYLLFPAYSTISEGAANILSRRTCLVSTFSLYTQLATACLRGESIRKALLDPEVALSFSNTYIEKGSQPQPIRLVLQSKDAKTAHHFEIDLKETRRNNKPRDVKDPKNGKVLGQRHFFNEQVTHTSHLLSENGKQGYLLCVNFEQPRVLLLKDEPFKKILKTKKKATVY